MVKWACQQNAATMAAKRDREIIAQSLDELDDANKILEKRKLKKCLEEKRKAKASNKADYSKSPSERDEAQKADLGRKETFSAACLGKGAIFSAGA